MGKLEIDVRALELFLKKVQHGPEALKALRYRTGVHWLNPSLDRLSSRMLVAYDKLCTLVQPPFSILDAGCMAGFLRHFMQLRVKDFAYVGLDSWDEALEVAREFQPDIDVRKCDLLNDEIPEFSAGVNGHVRPGWDYVWCSNINWGKNADSIVEKLVPLARRSCFFAQPPGTGDFAKHANEVIDCGETTLYVIYGTRYLRKPSDINSLVATQG
jgi:SAM-dependent methyltransferase